MKIELIELLGENELFKSMITSAIMLVIIFSSMNPLYAAERENANSKGIINLDNFLSFNWIPTFETHSISIDPYGEVKK